MKKTMFYYVIRLILLSKIFKRKRTKIQIRVLFGCKDVPTKAGHPSAHAKHSASVCRVYAIIRRCQFIALDRRSGWRHE